MKLTHNAISKAVAATLLVASIAVLSNCGTTTSDTPAPESESGPPVKTGVELVEGVNAVLSGVASAGTVEGMAQSLADLGKATERSEKAGKITSAFSTRFHRLLRIMSIPPGDREAFDKGTPEFRAFVKDVTGEVYDPEASRSLGHLSEAMATEVVKLMVLAKSF